MKILITALTLILLGGSALAESDRGGTNGCGSCSNGATGGTANARVNVRDGLDRGYFSGISRTIVSLVRDLSNWLDAHRSSIHPAVERPASAASLSGFSYNSNGQDTVTTNPGWRGY